MITSAKTPVPELLQGTLDVMILRTIAREACHGYAIARAIELASGGELGIEEGSLYPALHRLLKRGDLTAKWSVTQTGRRARVYRLNAAGKKRLDEELKLWQRLSGAVSRVLDAWPDAATSPSAGAPAAAGGGGA